jgi:hypothetical protein
MGQRDLRAMAVVGAMIVSLVAAWPAAAAAHTENSEGYATVTRAGAGLDVEVDLDYFELARVVDLGVQPGVDDAGAAAALAQRGAATGDYLTRDVRVFLDETVCEGRLATTAVERIHGRPYAVVGLRYDCPGPETGVYRIRYDVFFEDNDPSHRAIATYDLGGERGQFVFAVNSRDLDAGAGTLAATAGRFVPLGFQHILGGLDHVLFVVALLLGVATRREVLQAATSFTVAHSVTLALVAMGWLRIPAHIVEPLIALSIFYVAVQNLLGPGPAHRLAAVFGFGLLHGTGFAGTLQLSGASGPALLTSLVSFNVGIEAGQVLVIALLFPVLAALRRIDVTSAAHRRAAGLPGAATTGIAACGGLWFLQRLGA